MNRTKQTQAATTSASVVYDTIDQAFFGDSDNAEIVLLRAFMSATKAARREVLHLFEIENPSIKDWIDLVVTEPLRAEAEREKAQAEYLKSLKQMSRFETEEDDKGELDLRTTF